jgi:predicted AlkP superfamily pyrophosphatase or phosphodiesterase
MGVGMKITALLSLLSFTVIAISVNAAENPKPFLIVQITADQLRGDLLDRYRGQLPNGFGRIEARGYWVHAGDVDHALTLSFPGHATLATGMHPSHHGLTGNEWWVEKDGKWSELDVSRDVRYKVVDAPKRQGISPKNLLVSTLGEWTKSSNRHAKSVSLGTGNPIPVAYAGHHADAVYWYDSSINEFTTSTYYAPRLAPWVETFNKHALASFQKPVWVLTVPADEVRLANPDDDPNERSGKNNTFPHGYAAESRPASGGSSPTEYSEWWDGTPLKDEALLALAASAVDAEMLGQRNVIDYLAIDLGSTDDVGHDFGPLSLEQFDTLKRLDRALGGFLDHLDAVVGKGRYVLAFSADHGVVDATDPGVNGRIVKTAEIEGVLDQIEQAASHEILSQGALEQRTVEILKKADFIADAYTEERLSQTSTDPFIRLYANVMRHGLTTDFPLWTRKERAFHPARYNIIVRFKENTVIDAAAAVHGSPYAQDRLVPIIFAGAGIRHGEDTRGARTVDVAPTLAAAAGIAAPKGLDGHAVNAALLAR